MDRNCCEIVVKKVVFILDLVICSEPRFVHLFDMHALKGFIKHGLQ